MKSYSDDSDAGYFLKVLFQYPGKFLELHNDEVQSKRMNTEKVEKLVINLHDEKEYVTHIKKLK